MLRFQLRDDNYLGVFFGKTYLEFLVGFSSFSAVEHQGAAETAVAGGE